MAFDFVYFKIIVTLLNVYTYDKVVFVLYIFLFPFLF